MKKIGFLIVLASLALCAVLMFWPDRELPPASDTLMAASERMDEITISAELNPDERTLSVIQTMKLTNRTGETLDSLVLRTWPNAFQSMDHSPCAADEALYDLHYPDGFSSGSLVMARATVNAEEVIHRYEDEAKTVMRLPVSIGWEPGETIGVHLVYTVQIPRAAYRFGVQEDVWMLGNAFALPAAWEDGAFRTDAYAPVGDPFVSDCANYEVWVTVPSGYVCAGSGYPQQENDGDRVHYAFWSRAIRDFALVISPKYETAQAMEKGVLVTAYADSASKANELLKYARKAIACYTQRFGAYPYPSYTVAQAEFPHDGMEYPALSMIGSDVIRRGGRELEYAVAHETAHQWWYAAVGSDSWNQPWQDEALAAFSVLEYAQTVYGMGERQELERTGPMSAMQVTVSQGVTPGAPLDRFASMSEYKLVVYDRGAACLCALDETVSGGLDAFLRDYYETYAFSRASRQDFETLLLQSTGEDLAPLMRDYLDTNLLN